MRDEDKLDLYKKSLESAWGYNDYNDWPIKFNSIMQLFLKEFTQEYLQDYCKLRNSGISLDQIAAAFGNPARIYRMINPVIYGMKQMRIPIEKQREIVVEMLDMVSSMKDGSIYNEEGRNLILSKGELEERIEVRTFRSVNSGVLPVLLKLCGVTWAYTEALFFRAHDITKEIHGLYDIPAEKDRLLIRQYMNLNCREIWRDIPEFPYGEITLYTRYSDKYVIDIDAYNHLFHKSGNVSEHMVSYYLEGDGEEIPISLLPGIIESMLRVISRIHENINDNEWWFAAEKYAEIYWYRKKPLADMLEHDWHIPEPVYGNIRLGKKDQNRLRNLTESEIRRLIYTTI